MRQAALVPKGAGADVIAADWSQVVSALAGPGWIRLTNAVDGASRARLRDAAAGTLAPLQEAGDRHVRMGGLTCHAAIDAAAPVVRELAKSLVDGINASLPSDAAPIAMPNHVQWTTTTPEGIGFITPHRDPPTALGVIAILTLEGRARFLVWDDVRTSLAPARHKAEDAHQWETAGGDLVILRCARWPFADAQSPVHAAMSPRTGCRWTLTFRHNRDGFGADYFP
jgi:hypothetical protein